jgi:deoxyguanosine kinase
VDAKHIAIEGPIGVGKTTLCHRLAEVLGGVVMLEAPSDNPFLARFYADPVAWALPTQLSFLLQRVRQARDMTQRDLFAPLLISDFMVEKDRMFAELTLQPDELDLYLQVYQELLSDLPRPDLVIYLYARIDTLLNRIARRGIDYEQSIESDYLERLGTVYGRFFADYRDAPLLVVDTNAMNLAASDEALDVLVEATRNVDFTVKFLGPDDLGLRIGSDAPR